MDFFAHIAWAYIIFSLASKRFNKKISIGLAMLFGCMPDLFSWGIFSFHALTNGFAGRPDLSQIPQWTWTLYGITHSLFIFSAILLIIWFIFRKIPFFVWAWPMHILIDIPTHSREFLPTPFLWPLSDWHFPGFSWGQVWFMILNWSLILVGIVYLNRGKIARLFGKKTRKRK